MHRGGGGPFGIAAITGGNIDGTVIGATTPAAGTFTSIALTGSSAPTNGLYLGAANQLYVATNSNFGAKFLATAGFGWLMRSDGVFGWISGTTGAEALDLALFRDAANTLALKNSSNDQTFRRYGGNSGYVAWTSTSENLTLSTSGTTTDTAANLLPADSYIESVTARVTTTVATATDWKLGDGTIAGRFTAAQSGAQLTAGATVVGLVHIDQTGTSGPRQSANAKVRVTTTGTPSAGAIRITVHARTYVAPTS